MHKTVLPVLSLSLYGSRSSYTALPALLSCDRSRNSSVSIYSPKAPVVTRARSQYILANSRIENALFDLPDRKLSLISFGRTKLDGFSTLTLFISGPNTPFASSGGFYMVWVAFSVGMFGDRRRSDAYSGCVADSAVPGVRRDSVKFQGWVEARKVEGSRTAVAAEKVAPTAAGLTKIVIRLHGCLVLGAVAVCVFETYNIPILLCRNGSALAGIGQIPSGLDCSCTPSRRARAAFRRTTAM
jgi:hypothetical protein